MPKPETTEPIRDELRDFVHKSEEALVDARERWSETLLDLVPEDGAWVRKVVDDAFDFTEKLLENQRELAHSVLDARPQGCGVRRGVLGEAAPKRTAAPRRAATTKRAAKPKAAKPASAA